MSITLRPDDSGALTTRHVVTETLRAEPQGPVNPFKPNDLKRKNVPTGYAEETAISDYTFKANHRTFESRGYALDPSGALVGNVSNTYEIHGRPSKADSEALKRKRQKKGDPSKGDYIGPWARYKEEEEEEPLLEELASDEEYIESAIVPIDRTAMAKVSTAYQDESTNTETTEFHGSSEFDYQNRTYMHIPQDLDIDLRSEIDYADRKNYVPKKQIHTFKSHNKAITSLRFFPDSGHLLLSSSADAKVKIWDVYHDRELLRTYSGHTKSVTDTCFNPSGTQFLSASCKLTIIKSHYKPLLITLR